MFQVEVLELNLRRQLRGKTLLGEVAFTEDDCERAARLIGRTFFQHGVSEGLEQIRRKCPVTFALWLVNEAFYCYDGSYWPTVLPKVGLSAHNYSAQLGWTFLQILDRFQLPRFRRLNTHWSYLGPILAHCGIPKSRLPQFFSEVLPVAARVGVGSAEGLADLQQQLPTLRVSRSIEWFIRFGDTVSADFVRRCLDMYNVALAGGALTPATALGVPERVWREFDNWTRTAQITASGVSAPRVLRPRVYVDPSQGLRLELPAQPCRHGSLDWDIRIDSASPIVRTVPRFAGEGHTEPADVHLGAPFASAMVRLKEPGGRDLGTWVLNGLPADRPVMFFDSEDFSVLPGEVSAGPQGVLAPVGYLIRLRRGDALVSPQVLSPLGRLPFGWGAFEASICDFTGSTAVVLVDDAGRSCAEIELGERETAAPKLVGETTPHLAASDRTRAFVGSAPTVLIPIARAAFDEQWTLAIDPVGDHCNGVLPGITPASASLFAEPYAGDEGGYIDGVHAKLLIAEEENGASVTLVGSANATGPGWGLSGSGNVEAMVEMRPGIDLDRFVSAFIRESKAKVHPWIAEYDRSDKGDVDPESEMERLLLRALREAATLKFTMTYRADAQELRLVVQLPGRAQWLAEPGCEYFAAPLLLTDHPGAWTSLRDLALAPRLFRATPIERVTSFVAIRASSKDPPMERTRLALASLELSEDALNQRDDAIRREVIASADPAAVLNALVKGLAYLPTGTGTERTGSRNGSHTLQQVLADASLERLLQAVALQPDLVHEIRQLLGSLDGPIRQLCDDLEHVIARVRSEAAS